jgi:hypothetical protein
VQKAFGYRFVIDEVRYDAVVLPGQAFTVAFRIRNRGSAPFYYNWPVEVSLLDPKSREVVWKSAFGDVDIRAWLPGDQWNKQSRMYEKEPKTYEVGGSFTVPRDVPRGDYILALAILDPAGMQPAVRFAIENYFIGGRHPIGLIGVGKAPLSVELAPASFDDPAKDRTLHYELVFSAQASAGN